MKSAADAVPSSNPYAALTRIKWALATLSIAMSVRYLWWRGAHTLNYDTPVHLGLSLLLYFAEFYGVLSMVLFFLHETNPAPVKSVPAGSDDELPTVDMLITIFSEPSDILYRTLVGCTAIDYPRSKLNIYVLDDGSRDEIRAVASKFGCHYVSRANRDHAKAGNVNNGLKHSKGEIVAILDCDHVPVLSFLRETIGFFKNPKVAFVQMPHHFFNPDTFQQNLHLEGALAHEQDLFFHVVLPGRRADNAVMFAGSSALLRRSALESIGGIQVQTAIEDTHTSMRLQAKGYIGVYYDKILSGALSPESFYGYLTQRNRWTRGGIQIFILDNPLFCRGLSLKQRLHYLASLLYFFHGWARLIFMLAPLTFLLFSFNPIMSDVPTLLTYFGPHYIFALLTLTVMAREFRNPFWSDIYEAAATFSLSATAVATMLNPDKLVFKVTPKGEGPAQPDMVPWTFMLPHALLFALLSAGIVVATQRAIATGLQLDAYVISCAWAIYNLILTGCAIEASRARVVFRSSYRLRRNILAQLVVGKNRIQGKTIDMSEGGTSIFLEDRWYLPKTVSLQLYSDFGEVTEVQAEVMRKDWPKEGGTRVGLKFVALKDDQRRSLIRQIFSSPSSWSNIARPKALNPIHSLGQILASPFRHRFRGQVRPTRVWPRIPVTLSCKVLPRAGKQPLGGVILDISATGASLTLANGHKLGDSATLSFLMKERTVSITASVVRRISDSAGTRYMVRFSDPDHLDIGPLVPAQSASVA